VNTLINPDNGVLAALAAMHRAILPSSLISKLGQSYANAFYRFGAASREERVIAVLRDDGALAGGAFLSLSPASLTRRMALKTPLIGALVRKPFLAAHVAAHELKSLARHDEFNIENDPELVAVFVQVDQQGLGMGRALLRTVETTLREHRRLQYLIRTEDSSKNRAIGFYGREGFETRCTVNIRGQPFRIMMKSL